MILALKVLQEQTWGDSVIEWLSLFTLMGAAIGLWYKVNCHEHRCLRMSWHKDENDHPICKVHSKDHPAKSWFRVDKTHPRYKPKPKISPMKNFKKFVLQK